MIYAVEKDSGSELCFETHAKARRGRGVLFATAPAVVYLLLISVLFFLALTDLSIWERVKATARGGGAVTVALSLGCFLLGRRMSDRIEADTHALRIRHTPAVGPARVRELRREGLTALAVDPSVRSLGADVLLVAIDREGRRLPIAEGEPHSGQIHHLAQRLARLMDLPLESGGTPAGASTPRPHPS